MPVTTRDVALKSKNKEDRRVSIKVSSKNKKRSRLKESEGQQASHRLVRKINR